MVLPYLVWIAGTIMLAGINEAYFKRFWWLAPAALAFCLVLLALTILALAYRGRRAAAGRAELEILPSELRAALRLSAPRARRGALQPLVPRLAEVREACDDFTEQEREALRRGFNALDVHRIFETQLNCGGRKAKRAEAVQMLGWLADDRSVPALRRELHGADPNLAYMAGQSLARFDNREACQGLVAALREGTLEAPLAATLLESSCFRDTTALVGRAADDPDPTVRAWAAYVLGRGGHRADRDRLDRLAEDPDATVQARALEALTTPPSATAPGARQRAPRRRRLAAPSPSTGPA